MQRRSTGSSLFSRFRAAPASGQVLRLPPDSASRGGRRLLSGTPWPLPRPDSQSEPERFGPHLPPRASAERVDAFHEGVCGGRERHDRAERPAVAREPRLGRLEARGDASGLISSASTVTSTKIRTAIAQISTATTFELVELPLLAICCTASRYSGEGRNIARPSTKDHFWLVVARCDHRAIRPGWCSSSPTGLSGRRVRRRHSQVPSASSASPTAISHARRWPTGCSGSSPPSPSGRRARSDPRRRP